MEIAQDCGHQRSRNRVEYIFVRHLKSEFFGHHHIDKELLVLGHRPHYQASIVFVHTCGKCDLVVPFKLLAHVLHSILRLSFPMFHVGRGEFDILPLE